MRCNVRAGVLGTMTHVDTTTQVHFTLTLQKKCAGGKAPLAAGATERQALHRAAECAVACAADPGNPAAAPPRLLAAAVLFLGCAADGNQPLTGFQGFRVSWQHAAPARRRRPLPGLRGRR